MDKKPIVALLYDFDYTLAREDMQNFGLIPAFNLKPSEFWNLAGEFAKVSGCERILSYMYVILDECRKRNIKCTKGWLNSLGKSIEFYPGVTEWFSRINKYARERGLEIEHYIVSSGTKEIIDGCKIAKEFKKIFACEFCYDKKTKLPTWPKLAINYTQKTQYLYRISKGVLDVSDDININKKSEFRRIPHSNIIYIGDGLTDVPCMTVVKNSGGNSIAVYDKEKKDTVIGLMKEERVNYATRADYRNHSELDKVIKLIIDNIAITTKLEKRGKKEKKKL